VQNFILLLFFILFSCGSNPEPKGGYWLAVEQSRQSALYRLSECEPSKELIFHSLEKLNDSLFLGQQGSVSYLAKYVGRPKLEKSFWFESLEICFHDSTFYMPGETVKILSLGFHEIKPRNKHFSQFYAKIGAREFLLSSKGQITHKWERL